MESENPTGNAYALGHSQDELNRLVHQGEFLGELTEHVFRYAGLSEGMRVLDVGCGAGDVSFLARRMVGAEGRVLGVDRSPDAIAHARQRAMSAELPNVDFLTGDLESLELDREFDFLVGRLVLMYFPDPAAIVRRLLRFLTPTATVVFQELDTLSGTSEPPCEEYTRAGARITQTLARAGADLRTGLKLSNIFQGAGLPAPRMLQMSRLVSSDDSAGFTWLEQLTRTLLPVMQRTGVATAEEVQVDTLGSRIRDEVVAKRAVLVMPPLIGAWTSVAGHERKSSS